jgi:uncharacterized protein YraI
MLSQARSGLTAVALVLLCAQWAAAEPAVVETKLNLRSGPGPAFPVITVMPAGAKVERQRCNGDWCRVKYGRQVGYTSRHYLKTGVSAAEAETAAASYASTVPLPPPEPEAAQPTLTGPRIWRWHDRESRDRHWRQIGWRNRLKQR